MNDLGLFVDNNLTCEIIPSEFTENGFERAQITLFFKDVLEEKLRDKDFTDNFEIKANEVFLNYFNFFYSGKAKLRKNKISYMEYIDTDNDEEISVVEYIKKYDNAYTKAKRKLEEGCIYSEEGKHYLNSYLDIFKYVVFNVKNSNLNNVNFRKSKFLEDLISTSVHYKKYSNNSRRTFAQYNFMDPFAYDTILRVLENIKYFNLRCPEDNIIPLREELFLRKSERAFNRFICHNEKTYRIALNRHNSKLLGCELNNLSSVEEIKPIRLFEKIASYIRNNYNCHCDVQNVSICIIGHTEKTGKGYESECHDLVNSILEWYDLSDFKNENQKLKITINNIINEFDWPENNYLKDRTGFKRNLKNNIGIYKIEYKDYVENFSFSTRYLEKLIDENDMVFLLDCPWLVTENYNIKEDSTLEYFCENLTKRERRSGKVVNEYGIEKVDLSSDWLDSVSSTTMRDVNSQLNRIMATNTKNAGKIVRIFSHHFAERIESIVSKHCNSNRKKEVYVFCSETEGMNFTGMSSYPLMRTESYEGKNMTIAKYSNYPESILELETDTFEEPICFNIRLWSVVKYISIAYAYNDLKDLIKECFGEISLSNENYFEIYRDIFICIEVTNDMKDITVQLGFGDRFDNIIELLCQSSGLVNDDVKKVVKKVKVSIHKQLFPVIKELYCNVLFKSDCNFGDKEFKTAFLMNTYSCVSNVPQMMFWHKYRMANIDNDFNDFDISMIYGIKNNIKDNEFKIDLFRDKKIYDVVLLSLEYDKKLSLGIRSMLYEFAEICKKPHYFEKLFEKIINASLAFGNINLYLNAVESYEEMLN